MVLFIIYLSRWSCTDCMWKSIMMFWVYWRTIIVILKKILKYVPIINNLQKSRKKRDKEVTRILMMCKKKMKWTCPIIDISYTYKLLLETNTSSNFFSYQHMLLWYGEVLNQFLVLFYRSKGGGTIRWSQ